MDSEAHPTQLSLFPEIPVEGRWLDVPYDFLDVDTSDLVAFCLEYRFGALGRAIAENPRKFSMDLTLPLSTRLCCGGLNGCRNIIVREDYKRLPEGAGPFGACVMEGLK